MGAFAKLYFRPAKGETIHTVISPAQGEQCGVCGVVRSGPGAVENALVLLFEAEKQEEKRLLSAFVTDEDGEFAFGPLEPGKLYVIKVYYNSLKLRELEISV